MTVDDDPLEELLDRWELARDRGDRVTPEELCRDRPELAPELARRIEALRAIDAFLDESRDPGLTKTTLDYPTAPDSDRWTSGPLAEAERYRDEQFLAEGGLGRVFVARDAELPRDVALKRLQDRLLRSPQSRRRFVREAEITARLEHPGIVPIYGLGVDGRGHPFYAMRLIRGETMARAIERFHAADGPDREPGEREVALRGLLRAFLAACQTIAYAHNRGVIHRDIKPANVMLGEYGETLVVDWGLAKPFGPGPDSEEAEAPHPESRAGAVEPTTAGTIKGSPAYMSPEQAGAQLERIGAVSDVYSLGATLYTLLTGAPPFEGATVVDVLANVREGRLPPPHEVKSTVPRALEAVCLKAMSHEQSRRYAGALDLASDVERWLSDEPVGAMREPWVDRIWRWARRHRMPVAAAVAAAFAAGAVLAATSGLLRESNARLRAALDASERNLYARDIDLADRAWWDAQPAEAARFLAECPAARRGWEWHYLMQRNRPGLFRWPLTAPPLALGFAGDGGRVVAAGERSVISRDIATGGETGVSYADSGTVRLAAYSPEAGRLAIVTTERPGEVVLLDLHGGGAPERIPAGGPGAVEGLAFAPDGRSILLAVASREAPASTSMEKVSFPSEFEARLVTRDLVTGRTSVSEAFASSGSPGPPTAGPEGRLFCPVFFGRAGYLFGTRPGSPRVERLWPLGGAEEEGRGGLVLSPDGLRFAAWGDDHVVTVRETSTGRILASLRGHTDRVRCLAFRRDGGAVASGSDDRTVRVWNLPRKELVGVLRGHTTGVESVAFAADGVRLASASIRELIAWEAASGSEARVARESGRFHLADVAIGRGGRAAVVTGHRVLWDDAGGAVPDESGGPLEGDVVATGPLGAWTAAGGDDGTIALFDASRRHVRDLRGHRARVTALSLGGDGRRLASAALDGTVRVWDIESGRELANLAAGLEPAAALALSPDGTLVASGGSGPEVLIRDVASGRVRHRLPAVAIPVRRLAFHPDGVLLAVVRSTGPIVEKGRSGDLTVWDAKTGAARFALGDHPAGVTDAAYSLDGHRLVSADRAGLVRVWDAATGRLLLTLRGPTGPISRLAFEPDGHRLFAAGGRVDPLGRRAEETAELTTWDGRPLGEEP